MCKKDNSFGKNINPPLGLNLLQTPEDRKVFTTLTTLTRWSSEQHTNCRPRGIFYVDFLHLPLDFYLASHSLTPAQPPAQAGLQRISNSGSLKLPSPPGMAVKMQDWLETDQVQKVLKTGCWHLNNKLTHEQFNVFPVQRVRSMQTWIACKTEHCRKQNILKGAFLGRCLK